MSTFIGAIHAERAPSELRKKFKDLAAQIRLPATVPAVVFQEYNQAKAWIERMHAGELDGKGRRDWDSIQSSRFYQDSRNKIALNVIEYAIQAGIVPVSKKKGLITTVQRYFGNPNFRDSLGLTLVDKELYLSKSSADFDLMVGKFFRDLLERNGKVTSRKNSTQITRYAIEELERLDGLNNEKYEPQKLSFEAITSATPAVSGETKNKPKKHSVARLPSKRTNIELDDEVYELLEKAENDKLKALYYSLCNVTLEDHHVPLLTVGAWALFETVTALLNHQKNFASYFSKDWFKRHGVQDENTYKHIQGAADRIQQMGNTTKHDGIGANFNGAQLAVDMQLMNLPLKLCLQELIDKRKK